MKYRDVNNSSFSKFESPKYKNSRLRAGRSGVRIPTEARDFSLLQDVQTGPGAHPPFFNGFRVSFPKLQPTGRDVFSPASNADVKNKWRYISTPHIWRRQYKFIFYLSPGTKTTELDVFI
jgi:hypothetical protein